MDDNPHDTRGDEARQAAASRDSTRQPLPSLETSHFTLTVDEASARFAEAGLPRSVRSIQRYCQRGHLTCTTVDTEISEMYLIDPDSVERRIQELQQIETITRASGVSRQDAPSRDMSRHGATVRDVSRQDVSSEKIEDYERRIKELEDKAMHLEIDKRAREQIINMLKEDRESLFTQLGDHVRTITNQARVIGQLETRLELGPGKVMSEERPRERYEAPPAEPPAAPQRTYSAPGEAYRPARQPSSRENPPIEYPPRYSSYEPEQQVDNRPLGQHTPGVQ